MANDSKQVVSDNHHGSRTRIERPSQYQTQTTVAIYAERRGESLRHCSTGQGHNQLTWCRGNAAGNRLNPGSGI